MYLFMYARINICVFICVSIRVSTNKYLQVSINGCMCNVWMFA